MRPWGAFFAAQSSADCTTNLIIVEVLGYGGGSGENYASKQSTDVEAPRSPRIPKGKSMSTVSNR
jgi:hypothetical protein